MARDFVAVGSNGNGTKVAVDTNGWPISDFSFYVWAGIDKMDGTYALSFNGQASVTSSNGSVPTVYNSATNTSTGVITITATGSSVLWLNFAGTKLSSINSVNTGVTNVKLMRPIAEGSTTSHSPSELFNRQTKLALAKFSVVRYMDFLATNWSVQKDWSDRPLPSWASFERNPGGLYGWQGIGGPYEHTILLANETNTDVWLTLPVSASDAYVKKVAQLYLYGSDGVEPYTSVQANPVYPPLNANLKLYVEFSNEVWNTSFAQNQTNYNAAQAEVAAGGSPLNYDGETNTYYLGWRRVAKRSVEISKIFRSVFGDAQMMTRVRPVLQTQQGYFETLRQNLKIMLGYYNNMEGNYVADPHPPSYYFYGGGGSGYYNPNNSDNAMTSDTIFTQASMVPSGWAPNLQNDGMMTAAMGIKRVAYEGGPSLDKNGGAADTVKSAAVNDPRMTTAIVNNHNAWSNYGGELLVYYQMAGDYQWGFTSDITNLNTKKLNAIDQINSSAKANVTYGVVVPGAVNGGAAETCSRGWGCTSASALAMAPTGIQWSDYTFLATDSKVRTVAVTLTSASGAQVAVYLDGVLLGTQAGIVGTLNFNAGQVSPGLHGVIVVAKAGTMSVSKVGVQ